MPLAVAASAAAVAMFPAADMVWLAGSKLVDQPRPIFKQSAWAAAPAPAAAASYRGV